MNIYIKKSKDFKINVVQILHVMLSMTMAVDFLNGIFTGAHIGELFRILLLCFCLLIVLKYDNSRIHYLFLIFLFLTINIMYSFARNAEALTYDFSLVLKSIMIFTITSAVIALYKRGKVIDIDKIIRINLAYGPGLFILSNLMGIGNTSYSFGDSLIGYKSFFLSLNTVNIVLLVLYIYSISKLVLDEKKIIWILPSIYVAIPMLMLGTKTSFAMIFAVPIIVLLLNINLKKTWILIIILVTSGLIVGNVAMSRIIEVISPTLERQKFLFEKRDIFTYLFSTRNTRLVDVLKYYFANFSATDIFPGKGYYGIHKYIGELENLGVIPIEMDWADILVSYGPIGFLYTYVFAIKRIVKSRKIIKTKSGQFYLLTATIILLYASLAGHLFFEALSSTFYALLLAGCFINCNKIDIEKCYKKVSEGYKRKVSA